jgi:hypothetical protein
VPAIERDRGREGQRRVHHRLQRLRVTRGIGLAQQQLGRQRQRGGALQAGLDAGVCRRGVDGLDPVLGQQRHRALALLGRQRGGKGLERQPRQVNGEPQHGHDRRGKTAGSFVFGRLRPGKPPAAPRRAAHAHGPVPTAPAPAPAPAAAARAARGA